jgi:putative Holliday junction resolvase
VRVIAFDPGRRRVGVAISDASGVLARPLEVVEVSGPAQLDRIVETIERMAAEEDGVDTVVIGLPGHLDGTPTPETTEVRALVEALAKRVAQPIVLQDERLSSVEAEGRLAVRDRDWRSRKKKLDAAAAAVILQDYLDARQDSGVGIRDSGLGIRDSGDGEP